VLEATKQHIASKVSHVAGEDVLVDDGFVSNVTQSSPDHRLERFMKMKMWKVHVGCLRAIQGERKRWRLRTFNGQQTSVVIGYMVFTRYVPHQQTTYGAESFQGRKTEDVCRRQNSVLN
jgi:hypothetical protein